MPTLFSESLYKGRAFRLNSFIKLLQRKEGSKPAFFSGKVWWWWWVGGWGRAAFSCVYFLICFLESGLGVFVSFITHGLLLKKSHVRACWEANTLFQSRSQAHESTHSLTHRTAWGMFSGALYGLRR